VQDVVLRGSNGHIFVNNEGTNTIQVIDEDMEGDGIVALVHRHQAVRRI
jgi:hypothetical protein